MTTVLLDTEMPTTECRVRPDGRFVTTYGSWMIGQGPAALTRWMLLWVWDAENGGRVIDSCRVGAVCAVKGVENDDRDTW